MEYHTVHSLVEKEMKYASFLSASLAPVAQLVEQLPFKEKVAGSFPAGRTKDINTCPAAGFMLLCEAESCSSFENDELGSRMFSTKNNL
jgi:hypothetical protein